MEMICDHYEFEKTAKAVYALNETVWDLFLTEEAFLGELYSYAHRYMYESASFSTLGFRLTAFTVEQGRPTASRQVQASVAASLVVRYLDGKV